MALSDCEKCWDTPCICGHSYRKWTAAALQKQIQVLEKVLKDVQQHEENCKRCVHGSVDGCQLTTLLSPEEETIRKWRSDYRYGNCPQYKEQPK